MKPELYEYQIPTKYIPLIINGDESGLSQEEIELFNRFEEAETKGMKTYHWAMATDDILDEDGNPTGETESREPHFRWSHDLSRYGELASDVNDMVLVVMERETVSFTRSNIRYTMTYLDGLDDGTLLSEAMGIVRWIKADQVAFLLPDGKWSPSPDANDPRFISYALAVVMRDPKK